ncbi:peptide maturation system protein (TIGR04066 family) [Ruminiclostridium sufflavum DSM 19573]|uniref:Peptide maturation system protein (TIGR04066 family) n=1 Tax=Ruminiclostridium sufflavum DSM 19573 TaxID=1121337 RepID=A0A318Y130_9FIRM|nr:TIGR04066 family peptide maturation system protein [Ruminiclostridium sufflavum]PYG84364.1 peptide maturation system protein (TIGR04066 family) [Ruminiclostridium sufflavum DSM 19573]
MERVGLVYPYNRKFTPFLRYGSLRKDFRELRLAAPSGWGMAGKDASRADDGYYIGLSVASDFQSELKGCDTVIFCDYSLPLDFEKHIYTKIEQSMHEKKNIICMLKLEKETERKIRTICAYEGIEFICYGDEPDTNYLEEYKPEADLKIKTINTPVIFVLGVGESTNKFDLQLALRDYYLESGYRVSQVGTRKYCEYAGFHSFPGFMLDNSISEADKVFCFNNFIKRIEESENPDIFIIGVPGGIIPINDILFQDFGMLAYQVSCAVRPDVCILSLYYNQYDHNLFRDVNNSVKHKFGYEIDCFNISNIKLDMAYSIQKRKMSFLNVDYRCCDEAANTINLPDRPVFNISNGHDAEKISEFTQGLLEKYAEIALVNEA